MKEWLGGDAGTTWDGWLRVQTSSLVTPQACMYRLQYIPLTKLAILLPAIRPQCAIFTLHLILCEPGLRVSFPLFTLTYICCLQTVSSQIGQIMLSRCLESCYA